MVPFLRHHQQVLALLSREPDLSRGADYAPAVANSYLQHPRQRLLPKQKFLPQARLTANGLVADFPGGAYYMRWSSYAGVQAVVIVVVEIVGDAGLRVG